MKLGLGCVVVWGVMTVGYDNMLLLQESAVGSLVSGILSQAWSPLIMIVGGYIMHLGRWLRSWYAQKHECFIAQYNRGGTFRLLG